MCEAGENVLDVGCGICLDYSNLKRLDYHAVDVTSKFLKEAHRQQPNIPVVNASGLQLPFRTNSFDSVYCKDLLVHMPPNMWKILLAEMFRVARKLVVTLEGKFLREESNVIFEKYDVVVNGETVKLRFYNNGYTFESFSKFAYSQGVKSIDGIFKNDGRWQLTIYRL